MNTNFKNATCLCCLAVLGVLGGLQGNATAQSGTRRAVPTRSAPAQATRSTPVGLQGYCPVCVIEMKKWVRGNPSIQAQYDGKTYYFPGEEQRQKFLKDPAKYVPALGGDCVVCLIDMHKKVPGSIQFSALHKNRLFLFPNAEFKNKFMATPDKYAQADLALGGNCPVCRVDMKQNVAGKPEFSAIFAGKRYLFPGEKQREMFVANPGKYAVSKPATAAGSGTK